MFGGETGGCAEARGGGVPMEGRSWMLILFVTQTDPNLRTAPAGSRCKLNDVWRFHLQLLKWEQLSPAAFATPQCRKTYD